MLPLFRYALVSLVILSAWLIARGRRGAAAGVMVVFAVFAIGFWILELERPYGVLVDGDLTRRLADRIVAAETGRADEGFLAGEPPSSLLAASLARRLPAAVLGSAPTWMPLLILPLAALALAALAGTAGGDGARAWASLLWLAFSTGDLETLRGFGFVPGLWARPGESIAFVATLALLAAGRSLLARPPGALAAAGIIAAVWSALPFEGPGIPWIDALWLLTLDQALWLLLGGWGLWRVRSGPALALVAAGAALMIATAARGSGDAWAAQGFYRAGLMLAAIAPARDLAHVIGGWMHEARPAWGRLDRIAVGAAVLFGLAAASATLTWWDPLRWDPIARGSAEPLSAGVTEPMAWIARETPKEAVVLASSDYAPAVAVLGRRRVLRAPTLHPASNAEPRVRLERQILTGAPPPAPALLGRFGVRYVIAAPGDFQGQGITAPHVLAERAYLKLRHVSAQGFRIYEVVPPLPR